MPHIDVLTRKEVQSSPDQLHRSMISAAARFGDARGVNHLPGPAYTASYPDSARYMDVGPKLLDGCMSSSREGSGKHLNCWLDPVGGNSVPDPDYAANIRLALEDKVAVAGSSTTAGGFGTVAGNVTGGASAAGVRGYTAPGIRSIDGRCMSFTAAFQGDITTTASDVDTAERLLLQSPGVGASMGVSGGDLSPAVQQMLLSLPPQQQKLFAEALAASSFPQQLVQAMQAGSADAVNACCGLLTNAGLPAVGNSSGFDTHPGPPNSCGAQSAFASASMQVMESLQAQAALLYQQQPGISSCQHLMQLLAVPQQSLLQQSSPQGAALAGYPALSVLSQSLPTAGSGLASPYPTVGRSSSGAAAHWPLLTALSAPAFDSASAAASAVLHQEQSPLVQAAMSCAASPGASYDPLTAQLLTAQLAAAAAASPAMLDPMSAFTAAAGAAAGVGSHGSNPCLYPQQHNMCGTSNASSRGSPSSWKNRRNRFGSHRSSGISTSRDSISHGNLLNRNSSMDSAALSVLPAGLSIQVLSPTSFADHWGLEEAAAKDSAGSQAESCCGADSDSSSSNSSNSESVGVICSRRSSVASVSSSAACTRYGSGDSEVFTLELGPSKSPAAAQSTEQMSVMVSCDLASSDAVKTTSRDQSTAQYSDVSSSLAGKLSTAQGTTAACLSSKSEVQLQLPSSLAGQSLQPFAVWYPSAGDGCGGDSWYLKLPGTSRLFVGNIGCWVDEDMLLSYFGKYGSVVDVQVMWNTKMLARGRKLNREFAFISYSTPLEAARAVHWLDGCRLVDLEKDSNGVTVEYENGEGETATAGTSAAPRGTNRSSTTALSKAPRV